MSNGARQNIKILIILALLTVPFFVRAAGLVPCGGDGEAPCTVVDIFVLIARVTNWLIRVAGLYAVYEIISGGLWLALSMGDEESITKNKSRLTSAVVGFILVLFAYMLVNFAVNTLLVNNGCQKLNLSNPWTYLDINKNATQCK